MNSDLIARVKKKERDNDGTEQIHDRRGDDGGANPAHVFAQQLACRVAKLANFEVFHSEGFDHAVAGGRFLKDLAEIAEASLTVLDGAADLAAKLAHGKHY